MIINKYKKTKCINGCEIFNDESRYLYWENKKATTDEIEIESFLNDEISLCPSLKQQRMILLQ